MATIAATPRLSGVSFARSASGLARSRSGSLMGRTNSTAGAPTAAVAAANAAAATAASAGAANGGALGILREGYIMFYDTPTAEWQRVYMTLTHSTMSMQSTCSRFGRFVRPTTNLKAVTKFFCSLDVADAPERHIPVLGLLTARDELFIFRTPERRSMMDWCLHLRSACPSVSWDSVEEMAPLRRHFSPQLYGALFRPDLTAKGLVRTNACATIPPNSASANPAATPRAVVSLAANRRSSLSAGCPRRGPARRGAAGGASVATQMAAARRAHADAFTASTTDAIEAAVAAPLSAVDANTASRNAALCPDAKKAMVSAMLARPAATAAATTEMTTAGAAAALSGANDENVNPNLPTPSTACAPVVVSLASAVPLNTTAAAPPAKPADPLPSALEKQLAAKVKDLRSELDAVSGRNIDLEIDNANISARVLELEAEAVTMRDGIAEWRRRYQSLEQQMACQEESFKDKLSDERASLVANMKEEVEAQFAALKGRFAEREAQLEARIAELEKAQTA